MMKHLISFLTVTVLFATAFRDDELAVFNTQWVPSQPEVLTYRSTSDKGQGLYQVSLMRRDTIIEDYITMISPGFTKTVSGTMTLNMRPLQSAAKIIINNQIMMDTRCSYEGGKLRITTVMMPLNRAIVDSLSFVKPIVDFAQVPILVRTLHLDKGMEHTFTSINPRTNALIPLTLKVTGEGHAREVDCYKVEMNDFEGKSIYWVEKGARHRVMLVEQPESHRTTELLE